MKFSAITFVSLVSLATMVSAQGYADSCDLNSWEYVEDGPRPLYRINCRAIEGHWVRSEMDLNLCIANYNGELHAADNGNFRGSCTRCRPAWATDMNCYLCDGIDRIGRDPHFDLNTVLSNQNGNLNCFGHYGRIL